MAFLVIPLENAPELGNLNFTTSMDGVSYKIYLKYNGREDFWYADIEDIEENIIRQGIKVVSNWALLRLIQTTPRPVGELMAIDTRFSPIDPNLTEFGNEIELLYVEEGSLPS